MADGSCPATNQRSWQVQCPRRNHLARETVVVILEGHQGADMGLLTPGRVLAQAQYDTFFRRAREFEWLEF